MRLNVKKVKGKRMVRMICPVCKSKIADQGLKEYECTNCKSHLKISKWFRILLTTTPMLIAGIFPIIGFILAQHVISDKDDLLNFLLKYIISPLMAGLFAACASFSLMTVYPNKLTQISEQELSS